MPEACIICCDSSEWMRNGDFTPNRFDAQKEAIHILCGAKTQQNQENTVGLIRMGGRRKAEVLVNCTNDVGRIYTAAQRMTINGESDVLVAIQTAQLALKHRKNKRQTQRIILFVGSPITIPEKQLVRAGKKLKKNNVAVDVVNFGEADHNQPVLQSFVDAVRNNDNSNMVTYESGMDRLLSDLLVTSPIIGGGGGGAGAGMGDFGAAPAGGDGDADMMGLDPNMDPDLRMALMMSLQEERARQEAAAQAAMEESAANAPQASTGTAGGDSGSAPAAAAAEAMDVDDEDEDELALLQEAIAMSLREAGDNAEAAAAASAEAAPEEANEDKDFLGELLSSLPGMDKDDVDMDALLENLGGQGDEDQGGDNNNNNDNNDSNENNGGGN